MSSEAERQFREEVLPDELDYVRDRRASHGLESDLDLDAAAGTRNDLVGLALSGGGIRSATFNLGLLQALDRYRLFKFVDYLSTVSGGGFIGSSLTALMSEEGRKGPSRPAPARDESREAVPFPFSHTDLGEEEGTVRYLRGHSDYLAPKGLTDYLRAFALLSRGIALNLGLLLPILLIVSLLGMVVANGDLMDASREDTWSVSLGDRAPSPVDQELAGRTPRKLLALGHAEEGPVQALTYGHGEGLELRDLQVLGPRAAAPGREPKSITLWTDGSPITAAAFSPDRRRIAAVGADGSLWLYFPEDPDDLRTGLARSGGRHYQGGAALEEVTFSTDGSRLIATTPDGHVFTWVSTGPFEFEPAGDGSEPECRSCSVTAGPVRTVTGIDLEVELRFPPSRPPFLEGSETPATQSPAWNPRRLSLPKTGWALLVIAVVFVAAYPFLVVLAGPLGRLAAAMPTLLGRIASVPGALVRRKKAEAGNDTPRWSMGVSATWRVAGSLLLALPLFGGSVLSFDTWPAEAQRDLWPFLGFAWIGLWWLLSLVFLRPLIRRWRPRGAELSAGNSGTRSRLIVCALLLLAAWGVLALGASKLQILRGSLNSLLVADSPVWGAVPIRAALPIWWVSCLGLLMPILSAKRARERRAERRVERHRRDTGRLYAAANLPLWTFLLLAAFHEIPRDVVEYIIRSVAAGFGVEEGAATAGWASVALLGYFVGLQFVLWKAFGWLTLGSASRAEVEGGGEAADAGGSIAKPVTAAGSMLWREGYERLFSVALLALAAVAFFEVQPYLVYHFHALKARGSLEWLYLLAAVSFVAIVLAAMFLQAITGVGRKVALVCLGVLGPMLPFLVYLTLVEGLVYDERWYELRYLLFGLGDPWTLAARVSFLIVNTLVAAYLLGKLVDANATGMHGFYRDRLSHGYLVGSDKDGVLGPETELSLLDICQRGSGAPYHLINASLNMQREKAGAQRWRNSDFFFFSRRWCGGSHSHYCRTEDLEYLAPNVHLGSAMAVSAAAAAPNMGSYTSGSVVMLMTLLNVRLGLWLPTPRRVARMARIGIIGSADGLVGRLRRWWQRLRNRPSGYYLVGEMASRLDAGGPYVNLSDGGHLENTGAYELLRRRCRFIIIGDAESDPAMRFGSLAALMRYASIDLGIRIEINLEPLRGRADGTSKSHCAIGTIDYPPPPGGTERETGRLLYIKASVDGEENETIREYRARHPDFPHESTADQVFEEDQFEAYRALGFHIGEKLLGSEGDRPTAPSADFESWFAGYEPRPLGESG